ncbi:hypothetical protein BKA66DRAFT_468079 [Pyrenochaeta sp. MPI-SDFR-AT-0127]|nr:hypothetical protein BKA66DRAFT_468079 [Pyrenochaeta sp. MPI-SDFR-AT-0127]
MATEVIPPKYVITADDKRGLIVVTVAVVLSFVLTCFLIRLWLRLQTRDWKSDDWWLAAATLLHTAQSGVLIHLVDLGLGASQEGIPSSQLERLGRGGLASQILYICTLFASKCSVLLLYLRLSPGGSHSIGSWSVMAASAVWAVVAVTLIAIPCNPVQYYQNPQTCTNRWSKWQAIGAFDIATEILIFIIAIQLVWTLQMRFKAKIVVIIAFSARLPVIAAAGIRLHYLYQRLTGESHTFEYLVATQWQMGYAIMSSTITGIGPFLRPFNKEYTTSYKRSGYGHSSQRSTQPDGPTDGPTLRPRHSWMSQSYLMQTMPSRRGSKVTIPDSVEPSTHTHPSGHRSSASTSTTPDHTQYSPSSQAPIMLTADEHFQPAEKFRRHDAEVWVGDRSMSMGRDEARIGMGDESRLTIGKKTEFKVEVDRASRCI